MKKTGSDKLSEALCKVTGPLPGDELLPSLRNLMAKEEVFQRLLGKDLKRMSIKKVANLNNTNVPYLLIRHTSDNFTMDDGYAIGNLEARLILSSGFKEDFKARRSVGLLFFRYFQSDNFEQIFEYVPGLIELGEMNFNFTRTYTVGASDFPAISFTMKYKIDLARWKRAFPEIDWSEPLNGEKFDIRHYGLAIHVEGEEQPKIGKDTLLELEVPND